MMTSSRKTARIWVWRGLPLLFWMGVIFSFSSLQGNSVAFDPPFWYFLERKGAHIVEYAILTLLSVRFFILLYPHEPFWRILLVSGVLTWAYAATDELHQFFVPFRGAHLTDVAIDGIGILLMAGLLLALRFNLFLSFPPSCPNRYANRCGRARE